LILYLAELEWRTLWRREHGERPIRRV